MVTQIDVTQYTPAIVQGVGAIPRFVQRLLRFTVTLAANSGTNQPTEFIPGGSTLVLPFLRSSAHIQNAGAPSVSAARATVYGLSQSLMNQLSTLGMKVNLIGKNSLLIEAGDLDSGFTTVFSGTVVNAWADYASAPDVGFNFDCQFGLDLATVPATAASFTGSTDVGTIMGQFAGAARLTLENSGVSVKLSSPYFPGSLLSQIKACARHANINAEVINGQTLAIFPKLGSRTNVTEVPLIAPPPSGTMIGYPAFTSQGLLVKTVFDPRITFFGSVQVQSSILTGGVLGRLQNVGSNWVVTKLDHDLESQVPKGRWESSLYCYSTSGTTPVVPPP